MPSYSHVKHSPLLVHLTSNQSSLTLLISELDLTPWTSYSGMKRNFPSEESNMILLAKVRGLQVRKLVTGAIRDLTDSNYQFVLSC